MRRPCLYLHTAAVGGFAAVWFPPPATCRRAVPPCVLAQQRRFADVGRRDIDATTAWRAYAAASACIHLSLQAGTVLRAVWLGGGKDAFHGRCLDGCADSTILHYRCGFRPAMDAGAAGARWAFFLDDLVSHIFGHYPVRRAVLSTWDARKHLATTCSNICRRGLLQPVVPNVSCAAGRRQNFQRYYQDCRPACSGCLHGFFHAGASDGRFADVAAGKMNDYLNSCAGFFYSNSRGLLSRAVYSPGFLCWAGQGRHSLRRAGSTSLDGVVMPAPPTWFAPGRYLLLLVLFLPPAVRPRFGLHLRCGDEERLVVLRCGAKDATTADSTARLPAGFAAVLPSLPRLLLPALLVCLLTTLRAVAPARGLKGADEEEEAAAPLARHEERHGAARRRYAARQLAAVAACFLPPLTSPASDRHWINARLPFRCRSIPGVVCSTVLCSTLFFNNRQRVRLDGAGPVTFTYLRFSGGGRARSVAFGSLPFPSLPISANIFYIYAFRLFC